MKIAICDDQMFFHNDLKKHLEKYSQKRNIDFVYSDYTNGADFLRSNFDYDLVFMDFQMEGLDGLQTSKELRKKNKNVVIIFMTSFSSVVFDAFEVNAFRFLLKPIDPQKLEEALNDCICSLENDDDYIVLKIDDMAKRIRIDDIICAEASDKYCYISIKNESLLYKKTLTEFEKQLPSDKFFRCHRTYLVGMKHIVSHNNNEILLDNKERALISKMKAATFKSSFLSYIKRYNFEGQNV